MRSLPRAPLLASLNRRDQLGREERLACCRREPLSDAAAEHRGRRRARASRCEALPPDKRDEARLCDRPDALESPVSLAEQDDVLVAAAADRLDEATVLRKLLDQRRRHARE